MKAASDLFMAAQNFLFLIPFGISLVLYGLTMSPDMASGDWGELVTNAYLLSPSHPPGYPLFVLLYHVWIHYLSGIFMPFATVAYRANVLNVIISAAAVGIFQRAISSFMRSFSDNGLTFWHQASSIMGSLLFGLGPTVWHYSGHAEVFALNNLFLALIIWLTCECLFHRRMSYVYSGALVSGLALANQQTSVIYLAVFVPWILFSIKGTLNIKKLVYLGVFFILGFSPYFTLPFMTPNPLSWGDLTTPRGFWRHITREEYGSLQLYKGSNSKSSPAYADKISFYFKTQFGSILYVFVPICALLWVLTLRGKKRALSLPLLSAVTLYVTAFFHLCNLPFHEDVLFESIFQRFFMQPNTIVFIFFTAFVAEQLARVSTKLPSNLSKILTVVFLSALVGGAILSNYKSVDQSSNTFVRAYGTALLTDLPQNTVVSISGDMELYSMAYLNLVERVRPDVSILSTGFLSSLWIHKRFETVYSSINWTGERWSGDPDGFTIGALLKANLLQRPVAFIPGFPDEDPSWNNPMFKLTRRGLAQIASVPDASPPATPLDSWKLFGWPQSLDNLPTFEASPPYGPDSWETRTFELVCFYRFKIILSWASLLGSAPAEFEKKAARAKLAELSEALNRTRADVERMIDWVPKAKIQSTYTPSLYRAIAFTWFSIGNFMEKNRISQWGPQKLPYQTISQLAVQEMREHCRLNPADQSCKKI
eukprot:TRINITY_DN1931_c0_g1_i2.p1 TRINITY_DN1931_c0_g1~~TRINITY_DN1931_c0_g1_i2.p1  ORF type:complete len:709 (+),score=48.53 TRINITY_DN1931_c0_g1_i2:56-2182(+)